MISLSFFVPGKAATAGSKRGFAIKKAGVYTGKVVMFGDNEREKDWKSAVAAWAVAAMRKAKVTEPTDSPVRLEVTFFLARPKYHFRSNGKLKPDAAEFHTSKPDATKLLRCLEDALKQIVWRDDSQVCTTLVRKRYGAVPGAEVVIREEVEEAVQIPKKPQQNQPELVL